MKQLIIPVILLAALVVSAIFRSEALFFCALAGMAIDITAKTKD